VVISNRLQYTTHCFITSYYERAYV